MAQPIPTLDSLLKQAQNLFKAEYGITPTHCAVAPGRVNLIGEHTDYNEGLVLPMALPLVTVAVGRMTKTGLCRIITNDSGGKESNKVTDIKISQLTPGPPLWSNYVKGVMANFHGIKALETGFDTAIVSSVPLGGGLSSSAALEVAVYTLLEGLTANPAKNKKDKALACQKAEHDFAGVPCGIMDQFVSTMAEDGYAVLIDCRSLEATPMPLDDPNMAVLITNSNIKHELTGGEYAERRSKCFEAAKLLGLTSLREASHRDIEAKKALFADDDVMYRRFRHVVSEIDRTVKSAEALKNKDYGLFGKFMIESHNSLRDDFEVSCPESDQLVESALKVEGVYGSRMTGGGFGGCTVTLLKKEAVSEAIEKITAEYKGTPTFYVCKASAGARNIPL